MSSGTIIFTADTKDFRVSDADFIRAEKEKFEYFTQIEVSFPSPSKKVTLELFLVDFTKITNSIGETEQRTVDISMKKWISPTETKAIFLVSNKDLENRTYIDAVFWDEGGVEFTEIEFGPSLQLANISYTQLLFPTANNVEAFRLDRHEKAAHIRLSNLVKNKNYTIDIRFTKEDGNPENEYLTINDVPSTNMDINLGNVEHLKAQTVMKLEKDSWYSIKEKTNLQDFMNFGAAVQIVTKADMKIDATATLAYTSADGTVALDGITAAEVKIAFPVGSVLSLNGKKLDVVAHVAAGILCEIGGVDEGPNDDFQREDINPFKSSSSGQLASGNTCWFLGADRILPRHDLMNGENVRISISEIIHSKDQDGAPTVMTGESTVIYLPGASDNAERVHVNLNMLSQETEYDVKIKLKNTNVSKHVDEENYNTFGNNLAYQIFAVKNDDAAVAEMVSKTIKGKLDGEIFSLFPGNSNSNYCIKPGRKLTAEVNSISYGKVNNFEATDLIDFGNNESSLVDDPDTNYPNNKVVKIVKGDETWSGTTINNGYRYILTENDTLMTVRVWSPKIGVPVRLKLEDSKDPTHSVETNSNSTTTKVGEWETLTFDFNTQAPGTAALNLSYVFDKLSIFMDFGNIDKGADYYFDDVMLAGTWLSVSDLDVAYSAGTIISQSGNGNGIGRLVNDVAIGDTSLRIVVESGAFDGTSDLSMNILVNDDVSVTSVSTNNNICTMVVPALANAYAKQMLVTQPSGNGFGRLVNNVAIGDTSLQIVVESGTFDGTNDLSVYDNFTWSDEGQWTRLQNFYTRSQLDENDISSFTQNMIESVSVTNVSTANNTCTMAVPSLTKAYSAGTLVTQPLGSGKGSGKLLNDVAVGAATFQITVESGTFDTSNVNMIDKSYKYSISSNLTGVFETNFVDQNENWASSKQDYVSKDNNVIVMTTTALINPYSAGSLVTQGSSGEGKLLNDVAFGETTLHIVVTSGTFDGTNDLSISISSENVQVTNKQEYIKITGDLSYTHNLVLKSFIKSIDLKHDGDFTINLDASFLIKFESDKQRSTVEFTPRNGTSFMVDAIYESGYKLTGKAGEGELLKGNQYEVNVVVDERLLPAFEANSDIQSYRPVRNNFIKLDKTLVNSFRTTTSSSSLTNKNMTVHIDQQLGEIDKSLVTTNYKLTRQTKDPIEVSLDQQHLVLVVTALDNAYSAGTLVTQPSGSGNGSGKLLNAVAVGETTLYIVVESGTFDVTNVLSISGDSVQVTSGASTNNNVYTMVVPALTKAYPAGTGVTQPSGSGNGIGTLLNAVEAGDKSLQITVTSGTFDGTNDLIISELYEKSAITLTPAYTMVVPALANAYSAGTAVTQPSGSGKGIGTLLNAVEAGDTSLQIVVTSGTFDGTNDLSISDDPVKVTSVSSDTSTFIVEPLNAWENYEIFVETQVDNHWSDKGGMGNNIDIDVEYKRKDNEFLGFIEVNSSTIHQTNDRESVEVTSVSTIGSTCSMSVAAALDNEYSAGTLVTQPLGSGIGRLVNNVAIGDTSLQIVVESGTFDGNSKVEILGTYINTEIKRHPRSEKNIGTPLKTFHGGKGVFTLFLDDIDDPNNNKSTIGAPVSDNIKHPISGGGNAVIKLRLEYESSQGEKVVSDVIPSYPILDIRSNLFKLNQIPLNMIESVSVTSVSTAGNTCTMGVPKLTKAYSAGTLVTQPLGSGKGSGKLLNAVAVGEKTLQIAVESGTFDTTSNVNINDNYYQPDIMNCVLDSSLNSNINRYYDVSFSATVSTATTTLLLNTPTATTTLLLNTPTTATESFGATVTQTGTGAVGTLGIALDGTSTSSIVIVMDNGSAAFDSLNDLSINVTVIASGNISSVSNYLKTFSDSEPSGQLDYSNKLGGEGVRTTFTPTFVSNQLMQHAVPTMIPVCHKTHTVPTAVTIANDTTERQIEIGNTIKVTDTRSFTPDNTTNNNNHSFSVFHEKLYGNAVTANVRKSSINTNNFDLILDNQVGQRNQFSAKTSVTSASTASNICTMSVPALIRSYPAGTVVTQPSGSGKLFNAVAMGDKSLQITVTSGAFDATNDLIMEQYIGAQVTTARVDTTCNPSSDDLSTAVFKSKSNIINTFWDLDFTTYENGKFRLGNPPIVTNEKAVAQYKIGPYTHKTTRAERRCKLAVNGQSEVPIDSHIYVCTMVVPKLTKAYSAGTLVTQGSGSGKGSGTLLNAVAIDDTSLEIVVDSGTFDGTNDLSISGDSVQVTSALLELNTKVFVSDKHFAENPNETTGNSTLLTLDNFAKSIIMNFNYADASALKTHVGQELSMRSISNSKVSVAAVETKVESITSEVDFDPTLTFKIRRKAALSFDISEVDSGGVTTTIDLKASLISGSTVVQYDNNNRIVTRGTIGTYTNNSKKLNLTNIDGTFTTTEKVYMLHANDTDYQLEVTTLPGYSSQDNEYTMYFFNLDNNANNNQFDFEWKQNPTSYRPQDSPSNVKGSILEYDVSSTRDELNLFFLFSSKDSGFNVNLFDVELNKVTYEYEILKINQEMSRD